MESFTPAYLIKHYLFLSDDAEQVELVYESQLLQNDFAAFVEKEY